VGRPSGGILNISESASEGEISYGEGQKEQTLAVSPSSVEEMEW